MIKEFLKKPSHSLVNNYVSRFLTIITGVMGGQDFFLITRVPLYYP
jgi:hypothetical protein